MSELLLVQAEMYFDGEEIGRDIRLLISNGEIKTRDPRDGDLPEGVKVIKGKFVTPGLIDAHSHVGLQEEAEGREGKDVNEYSNPLVPHLRAIDGINPWDMGFQDALEGGVTALNITPGSANPIGGQGVLINTWVPGEKLIDDMVILEPSCIKMATGENPKRVHGEERRMPQTRMSISAIIRKALYEAIHYGNRLRNNDPSEIFDFVKEPLLKLLKGDIPAHIHAHRADDIATAMRIAKEFQIKIAIVHGTEAHKIAKRLADLNIPVINGPALTSRTKRELEELSFKTPLELYRSGVLFSITADAPVVPIKYLNLLASLAAREGLPSTEALKAITSYPAKILSLTKGDLKLGYLREGYQADVVIWSDHPLSWNAKVTNLIIRGHHIATPSQGL